MEVDNATKTFFAEALVPTLIAADGASVGAIIDTKLFESLTFVLSVGLYTSGTYTVTIDHGDDAALSDAAAVTITDDPQNIIASSPLVAADLVLAAAGLKRFGYIGKKRYVRITVTTSAFSVTGATIGVLALQGHAKSNPTDAQ